MASFKDVFSGIADAIKDLASLDVVTYKGTIQIGADGAVPTSFEDVLKNARTQADFKLVASTKSKLDGDTQVYFDKDATEAEIAAHNQLVENATAKRLAIVKLFEAAIADAVK